MYALFLLGAVSFGLSLLLTPIIRDLFRRWGVVDHPDNHRKSHPVPIPRSGGVAIAISYVVAFAVLLLTSQQAGQMVWSALPFAWKLFPAAGLIFTIGLLDDIYGLKAWHKLIGQIAAAGIACAAGVQIQSIAGVPAAEWWSIPLTIFWLTACSNAFNLIDGVDGLAAGMGLCATLTMLTAGLLQNNVQLALATIPLAGCLLGFLRYNFNPASVFLGDAGSLLIGFLLGCFGVIWTQKASTILGMSAPLIALAIPLLDTALAITRRFLRNQPLFGADRGHIHHRLLDRGLRPREVALVFYCLGGLAAVLSLLMTWPGLALPTLGLFFFSVWLGVQQLRYPEFRVAGRMVISGSFQRLLHAQVVADLLEQKMTSATSLEQRWLAIQATYRDFGFEQVLLKIEGRYFVDPEPMPDINEAWVMRIPLSGFDYIELSRAVGQAPEHLAMAFYADVIRRMIQLPFVVPATHVDNPAEKPEVVQGSPMRVG